MEFGDATPNGAAITIPLPQRSRHEAFVLRPGQSPGELPDEDGGEPLGPHSVRFENEDMAEDAVRVLIVDDHPVVRGGLAALLGTLDGIDVVGEAANGRDGVRESLTLRPDVVILDLRLPDVDGIEVARQITTAVPAIAVLMLSMVEEEALVAAALAAGARGYLVKGAQPEEIEHAVHTVARGGAVLSSEVAPALLGRVSAPASAAFPHLSAREREVLTLISRGLSNSAIAAELAIAPKTVGNHVSSIFLKLGVATRAEAIAHARDGGIS